MKIRIDVCEETHMGFDRCVKEIDDKINGFKYFLEKIYFSGRGHHYKRNHQSKDYEFYFERMGSTMKIHIHNPKNDWNLCIGQTQKNITDYVKEMYDFIILKGSYLNFINRTQI